MFSYSLITLFALQAISRASPLASPVEFYNPNAGGGQPYAYWSTGRLLSLTYPLPLGSELDNAGDGFGEPLNVSSLDGSALSMV